MTKKGAIELNVYISPYMKFENMEPFRCDLCLTNWNAKTDSLAEFTPVNIDPQNADSVYLVLQK